MTTRLDRRNFVKLSLATICGFSLSPLIKGCAQNRAVPEAPKTTAKKLESHPAIPTPKRGCYLGWHHDIGFRVSGNSEFWLNEKSAKAEEQILNIYKNRIGTFPAVHSFADDFIGGSYFPKAVLESAVKMRVYPMIRYLPRSDWKGISKGDHDHHLQRFSSEVSKAELPAFFIPFPGVGRYEKNHPWKDWDPEYFVPAWNRMYNIFEKQGANRYLVWGLHFASKSSGFRKKRQHYWVPAEQVNWVGISIWNQTYSRSEPFMDLLEDDYIEFTVRYNTKPFAIWELGDRHRGTDWFYRYSSKWLESAYEAIETLNDCKLAVFHDRVWPDIGVENRLFHQRNIDVLKKVVKKEYFITAR
jgi:flavodoxin